MTVPDLVCPVRSGPADSYDELRFMLRSAETSLPDLGEVFLLGSAPRWITGVNHLKVHQGASKYQNVRRLLAQACASDLISDPFTWVNDDIFFAQPQLCASLRMLHGGPLRAYLDRAGRRDAHAQGGRRTLELLARHGYGDPLNWGLHAPILVHKQPMREALDLAGDVSVAYHMRTIYGALSDLQGEQHRDVKIMSGAAPDPAWLYVSTSDISFRTRQVGKVIRTRFPDPSRYEG